MTTSQNAEKKLPRWLIPLVVLWIVITLIGGLQLLYMTVGFLTETTFENVSGEDIRITPIGIIEGGREIGPILTIKGPAFFIDAQKTRFRLQDRESLTMVHDMDDQNLQFVIVEYPGDDIRIMKLDADFWEDESYRSCCWAPKEDTYIIPTRHELPSCPGILRTTIQGQRVEVTSDLLSILTTI